VPYFSKPMQPEFLIRYWFGFQLTVFKSSSCREYLIHSLGQLPGEVVQRANSFLRSLFHCSSHGFVVPLLVCFWDIEPFPHFFAFRDRILPDRFDIVELISTGDKQLIKRGFLADEINRMLFS